jgi:ubiquinone/menaquinone biosynthesis C-methylase UbiE
MDESARWPGPADIDYQTRAQAGGFGQTLRSFMKFLDLPPSASVLDVGTGPGLVPRSLAGPVRFTVGSDASSAMLRHARSLASSDGGAASNLAFVLANVLALPFVKQSFDAVLATNLLFLLPEPAWGAAELARVVRPGGWVGWLNPSDQLGRVSAAAFADERGLTGFARFSLVNYGRIAEESHRLSGEEWAGLARAAGLGDVLVETRGGGLMVLLKGRKVAYA